MNRKGSKQRKQADKTSRQNKQRKQADKTNKTNEKNYQIKKYEETIMELLRVENLSKVACILTVLFKYLLGF